MHNNSYFLFLFLIILLVSCTKEDNPPLRTQSNEIKIEIISGNNQSDTIGRVLPEPLVVKVTKADTVLKNVLVQFTDSSCVGLNWNSGTTNQLGLVMFHWQLNPTIGRQQLKISVQDPLQKVNKSVMALAEGTAPPRSWLPGNCLPNEGISNGTLAQHNSGRIYVGLRIPKAPYYSDDNGQSWQKLTTFPDKYVIEKIAVSRTGEIYIGTNSNGIFYSADNGKTWESRSEGITETRTLDDLQVLRSGRIIVSTYFGGIFLSEDKGLHWKYISKGIDYQVRFSQLGEAPNGMLHAVSTGWELYQSMNNGNSWTKKYPLTSTFYVDDNGDQYRGVNTFIEELHRSRDNGTTWELVYQVPKLPGFDVNIRGISKKDGFYYFMATGYGLMKTKDFVNFARMPRTFDYLVTSSGRVVLADYGSFKVLFNSNP